MIFETSFQSFVFSFSFHIPKFTSLWMNSFVTLFKDHLPSPSSPFFRTFQLFRRQKSFQKLVDFRFRGIPETGNDKTRIILSEDSFDFHEFSGVVFVILVSNQSFFPHFSLFHIDSKWTGFDYRQSTAPICSLVEWSQTSDPCKWFAFDSLDRKSGRIGIHLPSTKLNRTGTEQSDSTSSPS